MKFPIILATTLTLLNLATTQNLLQNGNFDQPKLTQKSGWRFIDELPGWVSTSSTGQVEQGVGNFYNKNWGNKTVIQLDAESQNYCIYQDVQLSQGIYTFSLDYAARQGYVNSSQMNVYINMYQVENVKPNDTNIYTLTIELQVNCSGTFYFEMCGTGTANRYGMTLGRADLSYTRPFKKFTPLTTTQSFPTGNIIFKADTGKYLARCNLCGPGTYNDSASLTEQNPQKGITNWVSTKIGSKFAFKSDSGDYLSSCDNCWPTGSYDQSAFVYVKTPEKNPSALWTPEKLSNGKWAFRNQETGKYLTRCSKCLSGCNPKDFAFVHSDYNNSTASQWTISIIS